MRRNYQRLVVAFVLALVALALCAPLASAVGSDWDSDGIRNALDNCMKQSNPDQTDLDGDGQGDVCDSDRDGDGQLDADDPCPDDALNGCVAPPPPPDADGDGVEDSLDNCPNTANANQADLDGDGQGDVCDSDRDGDGQLDADDPCPDDALNGCVAPPPPPDTTLPDTTIDSTKPSDPSNSASASFSFSGTDSVTSAANLTFECKLDSGSFAACTSPKSYSGLSEGQHTFSVRAKDAAGNTDASPATYTWSVDTVAPDTSITAKSSDPSNNASPSFSFTSTEANSTFECSVDGGAYASCTSPNSLSIKLSDGSHTFAVKATDAAGNTDQSPASYTWTVDTTPPETTITDGPTEGGTTTQADASFSFTSTEAGSTFSCQLDSSGFAPCTSPKTYNGLANASHTFEVKAKDAAGNTDATPARRTWTVNATTQSDPVFVGAGDIASCSSSGDEATAKLLDSIPGTVYTLGDNAYESGTSAEFTNCYEPSWGQYKARTRPSVGNHEYNTTGASGYFNYFGAAAGESDKGYYSYDLGAWHIIALNSMCEKVGGCGADSKMVTWLKGDLATHPSSCTLAYWHHPVFSSGSEHGNDPKMIPSWDALYDAGADVVLSGHDHDYERFAPQTSSGAADPARGIREFVVGTGGKSHYPFGTIRANSQVRNYDTNGVLKLTLHPSSYDWQFKPEAGKTFSDSGSESCH